MKRKIAIISEHASPLAVSGGTDSGGQNVYVDQISRHLALLGYDVAIFTRWDNPELPRVVECQNGVRIIHIKAGPKKVIPKEKIIKYLSEFYEDCLSFIEHEDGYQLIHANFFMSAEIARLLKRKLGIPFVVTFHALGKVRRIYQGDKDSFPDERFVIEQKVINEADQIIAECPQDQEDLLTYYQCDRSKISIVPCGFDPHRFFPIDKTVAKMAVGLDTKTRYILQLGRLVPRKGIDTVIRALSKVKKLIPFPVKLLIVGGNSDEPDIAQTPEIGRLQQLAKEEGVLHDVIFTGRKTRDQLRFYYNSADAFVSTPWYEPFGITPLESMACGTPVIGSRVGGIQFTVIDGKTGFLVPAKNPYTLAEKLQEVLVDTKRANNFAENALKRVNTFFTWSTITNALQKVYEKILYLKTASHRVNTVLTDIIDTNFQSLIETIKLSQQKLSLSLSHTSHIISYAFKQGSKLYLCGNGGSASDANHFAAELVGRFKLKNRKPLPAFALSNNPAVLTAVSNDFSYDDIFARQIEAYGKTGDVLLAISTSGNSQNILRALTVANKKNIICIALTGNGGGKMIDYSDISLIVPSHNTQHIQEIHTHLIHTLSELIELQFSEQKETGAPFRVLENNK